MKESAEQKRERRQSVFILLTLLAVVCAGVSVFFGFYNSYNDRTLYAERLNQMREVTTQLFAGLEDALDNQWRIVGEESRTLQRREPQTLDELTEFMSEQAELGELEMIQCKLVAVDDSGQYYTQFGREGLLNERAYLAELPEHVNYVSDTLINNETRMVFLQRLEQPVTIQNGKETVTVIYYGISQAMEQLNPYFECEAYGGNSSVYVVDEDGLKLFSSSNSSNGEILKGYNAFTTLGRMKYLHGSSFDSAMREFREKRIAYSNAIQGDTELYYALYNMENSAWTLIFLVPSEYVAMNTVDLVNATMRLVMVFAGALLLICASVIFWLSRRQQKAALAAERRNNEKLEQINVELTLAVKAAERAEKKAREANKAKSEFLSNMSHDIRTPMNAIVGITKLMEHDRSNPEKLNHYIHKVQSSSQHLLSLINDVLDMSKIESGEVLLNREMVNLAEQVGQVESIIRPQAEERGQHFDICVHELVHEYLIGDAVRLRQIFINLLSNAVKYTPCGGTIQLDLTELPGPDSGHMMLGITVTDNGYGMTQEFAEHIFEPFTRAENSVTNKEQGTGLGMAITKNIVDLMGGTVRVKTEPGKGSSFFVKLPLLIDSSQIQEIETKSVLLVTEEETLIQNVSASFRESGIVFRVARTEKEAGQKLREQSVDTILLSGYLNNPYLSEMVQTLRRKAADNVLVLCVDYVREECVADVLERSDISGLIVRPFFLFNFARLVNQLRKEKSSVAEQEGGGLRGLHFLCAEDNALNAEILKALLDMNEATCVIYPNGKKLAEAFASVNPGEYDAILMDVQMPVMNGLEATRQIRNGENPLGREIPIIAMTANAFSSDVQACLDAGMDAHVAKPLDMGILERTLRSLLDGKSLGGGTSVRHKET